MFESEFEFVVECEDEMARWERNPDLQVKLEDGKRRRDLGERGTTRTTSMLGRFGKGNYELASRIADFEEGQYEWQVRSSVLFNPTNRQTRVALGAMTCGWTVQSVCT